MVLGHSCLNQSPVDPRLNAEQALEMMLRIVRKYKQVA